MRRVHVAFVTLALLLGANFMFMKAAASYIGAGQIALLRTLFGFLPLVIAAFHTHALDRRQIKHLPHFLVLAILLTSFPYLAFAKGTALLPSGVAGLLSGSIPLFAFLCSIAVARRHEPVNRLMVVGVLLGFAGVALSAQPWESSNKAFSFAGLLWMLGGAFSGGFSFAYARRFLAPLHLTPLAVAAWQTGLALAVLLLVTDLSGIDRILASPSATVGVVFGLGVLGTGLAFQLNFFILRELGAVGASSVMYLPPVVALLIGFAAGERLGPWQIVAMVLIVAGVALLQFGRKSATDTKRP